MIRAQLAQLAGLLRAAGKAHHRHAHRPAQHHRGHADAAGSPRHQQHLPGRGQPAPLHQRLPGCQIHERRGRHFGLAPAFRYGRDTRRRDHHLLGERPPPLDSRLASQNADHIARAEILHAWPRRQHLAHAVAPQHMRQRRPGRILRQREKRIGGVQRRIMDAEQHLALAGLRVRHIRQAEPLHAVITVHQPGAHISILTDAGGGGPSLRQHRAARRASFGAWLTAA